MAALAWQRVPVLAGALLLFGALLAVPAASRGEAARVAQAIDGDTLVLADGRLVRLIGINAPELGKDGAPDEPLARAARSLAANLAVGQRVVLELDQEPADRYGRLLAHVFLPDGRSLQEILLRHGLAFVVAVPPNLARLAAYQAAEEEARRAGRGVWGHPAYAPIPAQQLRAGGFRLVTGTVQRVGRSRYGYYLDLAPRFSLVVEHKDWERYFGGVDPERLRGKAVIARGWVTEYQDRLRLRLRHPAMLTLRP